MDFRLYLKPINDIEVKLGLCKSNFMWKFLAKNYEDISEKVSDVYGEDVPEEIQQALTRVRAKLVEKKGELPREDLIV